VWSGVMGRGGGVEWGSGKLHSADDAGGGAIRILVGWGVKCE
jgi:hypothetical protein